MRVRVVSTASGKQAIQVVSKIHGALTVHKHIGSFANPLEKAQLLDQARVFIQESTGQTNLLDILSSSRLNDIAIIQSQPLLVYRLLTAVYDKLGLNKYPDPLIRDLVIARIYRPASKRETREILFDLFGRRYSLKTVYRHLKTAIASGLENSFQSVLIEFAKEEMSDSLRLVFYDVTTLYFESGIRTKLKDFGFSKDHRPSDTQVVIGLVVNRQGFPLYFDTFAGNTFEGHTLPTVIKNVRKLLGYPDDLVVVADAAMLSRDNLDLLNQRQIGFIVGARMGNLPALLLDRIANKLDRQDGQVTIVTYHHQRLICQYSAKRAARDKSNREKQVVRAKKAISTPSGVTNRFRFVKAVGQTYALNAELVSKAEKLEGIKGYLTNTQFNETEVINRYHDLWRVENSFRLTKSDLEARPIFHRLDETIKAHLAIVFAGLAVSRYIEIKTGMSIKKVLKLAQRVLTHKVTNSKTGETTLIETEIKDAVLKKKIKLLKSLGH